MPFALPPMHTLRTFESVSRLRSFTGAAEELHLTVSAVSHQIRALEAFYGTRLLLRNHRDVALTKAGDMLREVVAEFLEKLSATGRSLRSQPTNRLSLSAPPSLVSRWLMPRLAGFLGAHPDVDFKLHATADLIDLEADEVDFAIRYGKGNWPGLTCEALFDETVFPVASPAFLEKRNVRSLQDMTQDMLLRDDFFSWSHWQDQIGGALAANPSGPLYSDSSLLLQAAESGQGIALGRSVLVQDALASGRLVRIGSQAMKADGSYYLVRASSTPATAAMDAFRVWLMAEANG
ncbi:LysR family transcriptional regulator, glycine cleavage system transcriptional activator [Dyella jiangningensis]|uniref:transcriptional regulator GcvA n=1 Tax=Dyella sp. AtDHG13 TaxID=1938897 RepID=UPI00088695B2|nr:transcriptional regulator GcvA [Dyella sp. AtDHG13]PXV53261.1 LysR family glycine cleavage system transcriptional activator [Dyella sp. AtDHG13]SDL36515.1 LysR family transcriptional regulator, glycine cleavage system transcriptional activator [Dyella jiangningensis]